MKERVTYTPEEKLNIVKAVFSRKRSIQTIASEKGIAPTLISLWKKQAEEAMAERFSSRSGGRRKVESCSHAEAELTKRLRNEARKAKIKASHLEASLKETKKRLSAIESQLAELLSVAGYKMTKVRRPRQNKKSK